MELATSNDQGELSPLEIGLHALKAIPKSEGGRGKKGGISAYAGLIGKDQSNVAKYRDGAEVYKHLKNIGIDTKVLSALADPERSKAQHLSAIHKAPAECWAVLAAAPVEHQWNVNDTEEVVGEVVKAAARRQPRERE